MKNKQTGGTLIGFIVGVIVGLGAALAVAVYVTKVPVPFLNKGLGRGVDMDAAEAQKNKNRDPNSPLYGKNPARPPTPAVVATPSLSDPAPAAAPAALPAPAPDVRAAASVPKAVAGKQESKSESKPGADPLGDLAVAKAAAKGNVDPFDYFVQAGAFRTQADADAQRAKMAMLGWEARVSEREQNGRAVFRVRMGPFTKRDDAEQLKEKLDSAGVESALVRVQR